MSSYASLWLGNHDFLAMYKDVDSEIATLFRENDLERGRSHVTRSTGEEWDQDYVAYHVARMAMLDRLDVMGFTRTAMLSDFQIAKATDVDSIEKALHPESNCVGPSISERAASLNAASFDDWVEAIRYIILNDLAWSVESIPKGAPPLARLIATPNSREYLGYPHRDVRLLVRAALEAFPEEPEIVLDISDLVYNGWITEGVIERVAASRVWHHSAAEPILVLTEGKTDSRVLRAALKVRSPHLVGFFVFADFEEFGVEGGADPLVKLVRGLAASKVNSRIVALFDNDATGVSALRRLRSRKLPTNIVTSVLPDLELARNYPTIGPGGMLLMDINGKACGIEMYLGETCLRRPSGELAPVRWKSYDAASGSYQGELEEKNVVLSAFEGKVERGEQLDWSGLDLIISHLRSSFARSSPQPPHP
jgi:hypothetical protein